MVFYALLFNIIAESHNWFKNIFKEILSNSFDVTFESEVTTIIIDRNLLQSFGMIISGVIWPFISKYLNNKNCMILSGVLQSFCMFLFGVINDAYMIPWVFLIKGITFGVYSVGIAVIYDFVPKELLKLQFTYIIVISVIIAKSLGKVGMILYQFLDQSFYKVNLFICICMLIGLTIFYFFYNSTFEQEGTVKIEEEVKEKAVIKTLIKYMGQKYKFYGAIFYALAVTLKKSLQEINFILYRKPKELGGLNKSSEFLNDLDVFQIAIQIVLLFCIQYWVPKYISNFRFIQFIFLVQIFSYVFLSIFQYVKVYDDPNQKLDIYGLIYCILNILSCQIFNPQGRIIVNDKVDKEHLTIWNAFLQLFSNILIIFEQSISKYVIDLVYDDFLEPLYKHQTFYIYITLILMLLAGFISITLTQVYNKQLIKQYIFFYIYYIFKQFWINYEKYQSIHYLILSFINETSSMNQNAFYKSFQSQKQLCERSSKIQSLLYLLWHFSNISKNQP